MSDILFEEKKADHGKLGIVTLNRLKALNALTFDMIMAMSEKLESWANDSSVKAVVVCSNSDKAFCAGGDVVSLYKQGRENKKDAMAFFWHEYRLNHLIYHYPKPYIPILNGITMGGGVGISLHGNSPVATENFSFAMPETGIGFFPDVGGSYILAKSRDNTGMYLGLTGARISVWDAKYCGLTPQVISSTDITSFIDTLLRADLNDNATDKVHALINEFTMSGEESNLEKHSQSIDKCFSQDNVPAILESLAKENSEWVQKTTKILSHKSPLSLLVTFEQLRRAKGLTMGECMQMEYRMVSRFVDGADFYEGVRALLVDKDKSPIWSHTSVADVTQEDVDAYFAPLSRELDLAR